MRIVLQRVARASVRVGGELVGQIGPGLLALVGVERDDDATALAWCARKLLELRIFTDAEGKMNLDVREAGGAVLLVSQFTLAASTRKGRRPSLGRAAPPEVAEPLFEELVAAVAEEVPVARGRFGAAMEVELVNDGPVTFVLERRSG